MSVDNHNITIIATDGSDLKPTEAVSLVSLAGERYDFIISADKEVKNYWIRFKGLLDCRPKGAFQVALLHYEGASTDYPQEKVTYETAGRSGLVSVSFELNEKKKTFIFLCFMRTIFKSKPLLICTKFCPIKQY